jgi:hypothetical protein
LTYKALAEEKRRRKKRLSISKSKMPTRVDIFLCAGQNLTIGVSEVVEASVLTGSARIPKALVSSLQLGSGLAIGENLVWWAPKLEPNSCSNPNLPPSNIIIWSSLSSSSSSLVI